MPAAALAPDVTRHDVNWGAEGARLGLLRVTHAGFGLSFGSQSRSRDAFAGIRLLTGPAGVVTGKHFFQICVAATGADDASAAIGWVHGLFIDAKTKDALNPNEITAGAMYSMNGGFVAPTAAASWNAPAPKISRSCALGCLLDLDATPARMAVFVDGEPMDAECAYDFPKDGRAWYLIVSLWDAGTVLHSCPI